MSELAEYLKHKLWYSTAADMEHLKTFWLKNFGEHPDFRPNYIVPNICSIIRCLSSGSGFFIIREFLCREAIDAGQITWVWSGAVPVENTLYFGTRKKTMYQDELSTLEKLFREKWERTVGKL